MAIFNRKRKDNTMPDDEQVISQQGSPPYLAETLALSTIGADQVREAVLTLQKYKQGKANLENKIVENEQWYKLRHWETLRKSKTEEVEPVSGWLFNSIANKHADAMDNYPSANILPREEGDKKQAEILTSIIPVILDRCNFEQTYSDAWDYKLKHGTGVYGVFWDAHALNNLGDVTIEQVDLLSLFWEPGIKDIQRSANVFSLDLVDTKTLESAYPHLKGKLSGSQNFDVAKYVYDDNIDTTGKSIVVDWYYKKQHGDRTILHYCKFVEDEVLYATENDPEKAETGWYDHGEYPFVFDPLFKMEGTPCGFGYVDICKSAQEFIDRGNAAVMKNMLVNAKPRFFIRNDGSVNEQEYADTTKDFIHVDGALGQDSVMPVVTSAFREGYVTIINNKIDELKEVSGNRDISNGGSTAGVTAASAIAAMQEAGSKLSRDASKASYRAFRKVVLLTIELIRQFYDVQRSFRIVGNTGNMEFVPFDNSGIKPMYQGMAFGVDQGYSMPLFDLEISCQKQSPYSKMAQNELSLQLYAAGFFNPQAADMALACLDMMDFDRKQFVMKKIAENGTMYQQLMMMQQQMMKMAALLDAEHGTNMAGSMMGGATVPTPAPEATSAEETEALGGAEKESSVTKNARQRVADSTAPR